MIIKIKGIFNNFYIFLTVLFESVYLKGTSTILTSMARNALRADDVSWLLRTVKIPQCVAFGCSKGLLKLILVSFLVFAWLLASVCHHYNEV